MSKARKIFLWAASVSGGVIVLATAAAIVISHLFNAGVIGSNFKTEIEAHYHVRASQIRIGFRPLPTLALSAVRVSIPGELDASAGTAIIHLEVLPLFAGELRPAKIELVSPVVSVRLPARPASSPESTLSQRIEDLIKNILRPLAGMERTALIARNGSLKIFNANDRSFFIEHIELESAARHGGVDFKLTSGRSSFWQALELKGLIDLGALKGSGVLNVTGANPENLEHCLDASASGRTQGSLADFTAALYYTGPGRFRADFTASVPSFIFGIGPQTMTIKDGFLAGVFLTDAKGIELTVSDFRFASPHLYLTASFAEKYSDGNLSLTLNGRNTDASTVRSILLAVNRKTGGIDRFFNILRQAKVPKIHLTSHANNVSGLLKLKNVTVECPIEKGVVLTPKVKLLVSNVSGDMLIKDGVLTATRLSGQTRGSSTRGGELTVGLPHDNPLFHLYLPIEADLSELPAVLNRVATDSAFKHELAQISDVSGKTRGRLIIGERLGALAVKVSTGPFSLACHYSRVPGPVSLQGASFTMDGDRIGFRDVDAVLAGSTLSVSGSVKGFMERHAVADLQLKGRLGPEGNKIAASLAGLPNWLKPISGLDLLDSTLTWEEGAKTSFNGKMQLSGGPLIETDVVKTPGDLSIRRLAIKDANSDAQITLDSLKDEFKIGFSGMLSDKTFDGLLAGNWPYKGPIKGKFQAELYPGSPDKSSALGEITLSDFRLPGILPASARIEKATIEAHGKKLDIKSAVADWEGARLNLTGSVALTHAAYRVDVTASTESLDLNRMLKSECIIRNAWEKSGPPGLSSPQKPWDMPITGVVRVKSKRLSYGKLIWTPAEGDIVINRGSVYIRITHASICGISTPGKIVFTPAGTGISLDILARQKELQPTLACLFSKQRLLSGSYELTGHIEAKSPCVAGKELPGIARTLQGHVEFKARDGRIFRFNTFTKIISLLSISEIYRGVVPHLLEKGCPYKTLQVGGTIKNGKLVLSDSVLDGPSIKMVFNGQIDLVRRKLNVIALVAPQRTVERVVNATPVVGKVLKDAFITMPVRISGNFSDPSVVLLAPGAVGQELLGVMQRLVKLPLTIFQPLIEGGSPGK